MKRFLLATLFLLLAGMTMFPNLIVFIGIYAAVYHKVISAFFCLGFAYNIAKFVESKYQKYLEKNE